MIFSRKMHFFEENAFFFLKFVPFKNFQWEPWAEPCRSKSKAILFRTKSFYRKLFQKNDKFNSGQSKAFYIRWFFVINCDMNQQIDIPIALIFTFITPIFYPFPNEQLLAATKLSHFERIFQYSHFTFHGKFL